MWAARSGKTETCKALLIAGCMKDLIVNVSITWCVCVVCVCVWGGGSFGY